MAIKILVVDDHALVRDGLRFTLKKLDTEAMVFEAQDCDSALRTAEKHPDLDLVLLDLNLPGNDGFFALTKLRRQHPSIPVVMVSANEDRKSVTEAIDRGAMGFIPKSAATELMLSALRLVLAGGIYLPPEALTRTDAPKASRSKRLRTQPHTDQLPLTERQTEVLKLVAEGKSNKAISECLSVCEATVKTHIGQIFKLLKVKSRTQAAFALKQRGTRYDRPL